MTGKRTLSLSPRFPQFYSASQRRTTRRSHGYTRCAYLWGVGSWEEPGGPCPVPCGIWLDWECGFGKGRLRGLCPRPDRGWGKGPGAPGCPSLLFTCLRMKLTTTINYRAFPCVHGPGGQRGHHSSLPTTLVHRCSLQQSSQQQKYQQHTCPAADRETHRRVPPLGQTSAVEGLKYATCCHVGRLRNMLSERSHTQKPQLDVMYALSRRGTSWRPRAQDPRPELAEGGMGGGLNGYRVSLWGRKRSGTR